MLTKDGAIEYWQRVKTLQIVDPTHDTVEFRFSEKDIEINDGLLIANVNNIASLSIEKDDVPPEVEADVEEHTYILKRIQ